MVDIVASDLLMLNQRPTPPLLLKLPQKLKPSHGTDMDTPDSHTLMVDTDTHTLVFMAPTILARDLPNHPHTMVMDTDVVMDMAVTDTVDTEDTDMAVVMATDMAVNSYLQEAKRFYYFFFQNFECHLLTLEQKSKTVKIVRQHSGNK